MSGPCLQRSRGTAQGTSITHLKNEWRRDPRNAAVRHQTKITMTLTNSLASTKSALNAKHVKFRPSQKTNQRQNESNHDRWMNRHEHYCGLAQQAGNADAVTREQYW